MKQLNVYINEKLVINKDTVKKYSKDNYELRIIDCLKNYLTGFLHYEFNEDYKIDIKGTSIYIHFIYKFPGNRELALKQISKNIIQKLKAEFGNDEFKDTPETTFDTIIINM